MHVRLYTRPWHLPTDFSRGECPHRYVSICPRGLGETSTTRQRDLVGGGTNTRHVPAQSIVFLALCRKPEKSIDSESDKTRLASPFLYKSIPEKGKKKRKALSPSLPSRLPDRKLPLYVLCFLGCFLFLFPSPVESLCFLPEEVFRHPVVVENEKKDERAHTSDRTVREETREDSSGKTERRSVSTRQTRQSFSS